MQERIVVDTQVGFASDQEFLIRADRVDLAAVVDNRRLLHDRLVLVARGAHGVSTHSMASLDERPSELRTATDRHVRPGTAGTVTEVSFV